MGLFSLLDDRVCEADLGLTALFGKSAKRISPVFPFSSSKATLLVLRSLSLLLGVRMPFNFGVAPLVFCGVAPFDKLVLTADGVLRTSSESVISSSLSRAFRVLVRETILLVPRPDARGDAIDAVFVAVLLADKECDTELKVLPRLEGVCAGLGSSSEPWKSYTPLMSPFVRLVDAIEAESGFLARVSCCSSSESGSS